jgi:hypothetical protein
VKSHLSAVCWLIATTASLAGMGGSAPSQKFATRYPLDSPKVPAAVREEARPTAWTGIETGPIKGLAVYARESQGAVWMGCHEGAARFDPKAGFRWDRWQYFGGPRWLPDNSVQNIWVDESSGHLQAWVRTRTGVALLEWRPLSLEEKARYFEERIEARHVRHGLVADSHLAVAGNHSSNVKSDSDNDGLWTAIYLGAEAFRYAATHEPEARQRAQRAFRALLRLEQITGVPGFYARSFKSMDEPRPQGGEWHPTPDGQWLWKGDTSSDESVGHYFAYSAYFDHVAEEQEKAVIRGVVRRMTDYLIRNDYELIDLDGKPTRWGRWSEKYYQTEEGRYESALRSLELLSFLKTTSHTTGDAKYDQAYLDRIQRGYAEKMRFYRRWPDGGEINFSDDELAYLSYYPLLIYEKDAALRAIYLDGLRFTWGQVRPDLNPLWDYMSVACGAARMSEEVQQESRRTLERIPMDLIDWPVRNSHRLDVKFRSELDRFGRRQLAEVLAPDERRVSKWNGNPYIPDGGGNGQGEDDGAFFLLPYWMGRYYGWVK